MSSQEAVLEEGKDPVGLPDFTLPVAVVAQVIASLKVDIVSQSIGNLKVDIAAQSVESLNVNIAGSSVTLNVNVTNASLNVNVTNSSLNVNITNTSLNVNVTNSRLNIAITSPLDTSGNVKINIAAQSITLYVYVANSQLNVNVTNSSLNVYVTNSTLSVSITNTSLNVNVTNSSITIVFGSQTTGVKTEDVWSAEQGYNKILNGSALISGGGGASLITYTVPYGKKLYIAGISVTPLEYGTPFFGYLENETDVILYIHYMNDRSVVMLLPVPIPVPGGKTIDLYVLNQASDGRHFYGTILAWEK